MTRRVLLLLSCLWFASCATQAQNHAGQREAGPEARSARQEIEGKLQEVLSMRAAAEDALNASKQDEALWEDARLSVPTPFNRDFFEDRLETYAADLGMTVSDFILQPMTVARLEPPATLEPTEPFPIAAKDAILSVPLRFVLQDADPAKMDAFVRSLPQLGLLFVPENIRLAGSRAAVEGMAFTFRQLDPLPTWTVVLPEKESWLKERGLSGEEGDVASAWSELEAETRKTNEILQELSRQRWMQIRVEGWLRWWKVASETRGANPPR